MEFGPYIYQETDTYSNQVYTSRNDNLTNIVQDTVLTTFNQNLAYSSAKDDYLDTEMWLVNQAAIGTWYGTKNAEAWKGYMSVMYGMVNQGLG